MKKFLLFSLTLFAILLNTATSYATIIIFHGTRTINANGFTCGGSSEGVCAVIQDECGPCGGTVHWRENLGYSQNYIAPIGENVHITLYGPSGNIESEFNSILTGIQDNGSTISIQIGN